MARIASVTLILLTLLTLSARRAAADPIPFGRLATQGMAAATTRFADRRHHWYDETVRDRDRYPQATIWGAFPLFETIDAVGVTDATSSALARVRSFARGAERYWDPRLGRHGGFAPYPGDRGGRERAWFDDNGWWALAFLDAHAATHDSRYLRDAQRALDFTTTSGWDPAAGGIWWNTSHPFKAGEAMGAAALAAAQLYAATGRSSDRDTATRILNWADAHLLDPTEQLYSRSDVDSTPMPYVEGPFILAWRTLCDAVRQQSYCDRARTLADRAYDRFATLSMGPQYDVIYLHTMIDYGRAAGDARWVQLARDEATRALANATDPAYPGLYERAWDGSDMAGRQAVPGMLRTHAATVELLAWLAREGAS